MNRIESIKYIQRVVGANPDGDLGKRKGNHEDGQERN